MLLTIPQPKFAEAFPKLLAIWPGSGETWTAQKLAEVKQVLNSYRVASASPLTVTISTKISKTQLRSAGLTLATQYSTPSKYVKYFGLGGEGGRAVRSPDAINQEALRLRPGARVSLSLEGYPTTAQLATIRRTSYQGSPNWVKAEVLIDVSKIPLYLERETKCTCKYCGTEPKGDDTECRKCGAPLPPC